MVAYVTITDVETDPDAPLTAVLGKKFRDNPIAITEGSTGAEYMQTSWHPYNSLKVGDSNTGELWSFAVNGAVSAIETPDFVDGYEYRLNFVSVGGSPLTSDLIIQFYRQTNAAYSGGITLLGALNTGFVSGFTEINRPRDIAKVHFGGGNMSLDTGDVQGNTSSEVYTRVSCATAQKLLKARLSLSTGGNFDAGAIYMYRRRVY